MKVAALIVALAAVNAIKLQGAPITKTWPQDSSAGPTNTCVNPVSIESPPTADGHVGGPPCAA